MNLKEELINLAKGAQAASRQLVNLSTQTKNKVLRDMADSLIRNRRLISNANKQDLGRARLGKLSPVFIDRLSLCEKRIKEMANSLLEIARLQDPVGCLVENEGAVFKTQVPQRLFPLVLL